MYTLFSKNCTMTFKLIKLEILVRIRKVNIKPSFVGSLILSYRQKSISRQKKYCKSCSKIYIEKNLKIWWTFACEGLEELKILKTFCS